MQIITIKLICSVDLAVNCVKVYKADKVVKVDVLHMVLYVKLSNKFRYSISRLVLRYYVTSIMLLKLNLNLVKYRIILFHRIFVN